MDNKYGKLFVIKQSDDANLCLECTFGGRVPSGSTGGAYALSQAPWPQWGATFEGRMRPTYKGKEGRGWAYL